MYINVRLSDLNLENQIHQVFQMPALLITLNPYQGLKRKRPCQHETDHRLLITLNPYQGLKRKLVPRQLPALGREPPSFNYLESLSGIETPEYMRDG